jgi:hypothetical protein
MIGARAFGASLKLAPLRGRFAGRSIPLARGAHVQPSNLFISNVPLVPPKPKEFDSA